jgi:hypothetical protein
MADGQPGGPFYERRWFQGTAAVVALLGALIALIGPLRGAVSDLFSSSTPHFETEVVFDRGSAMNGKLAQAKRQLRKEIHTPLYRDAGLALRTFGGSCHGGGEPVVDFGTHHVHAVIQGVNGVERGEGPSDVYDAVSAAVRDLTDLPAGTETNVLVYLGAVSGCGASGNPARENAQLIHGLVQQSGIRVTIRFFGIGLSPSDSEQLHAFKHVLHNAVEVETSPGSGTGLSNG